MESGDKKSVLAHWYYSVEEWEGFVRLEKKNRGLQVIFESLAIILGGSILVRFGIREPWSWSISLATVLAIAYGLLRFTIRLQSMRWNKAVLPEVVITPHSVLINGRRRDFHNDDRWLRRASLTEKDGRNLIAITYEWHTRRGITYDEIIIPIPKGKLKEGIAVEEELNKV